MLAIEVLNLKKTYQLPKPKNGERTFEAVRGVSFSVNEGEIFGILGPNGAGKTTTLEILETLKRPTSGEIQVLGLKVRTHILEIKKKIGVQLQSSEYLDYLTLKELVTLFASIYHQKVDPYHILDLVGLKDFADFRVKNLSGGQKQRFTIATTLVNDPKIIFLDEPTTGLDPKARRELWGLVKSLNGKGITILLTTHYMEEAEYLCDRVAVMDKGLILTINNPRTLIERLSDTTQVSFFTNQEMKESFWSAIPEVTKLYSNFPKVILEIKSLDSIEKIVDFLKKQKISFTGFTVKTATLEDVYLDLTGHEFEHTNGS